MTIKNSLEVIKGSAFATNVVTYGAGKSSYVAEPVELLSASQDVTGSWVDCGDIYHTCNVGGSSNNLVYLIDLDINDSTDVRFRVVGNIIETPTVDYVFSIYDITANKVNIDDEFVELTNDTDQSVILEFQTAGIPYIQLQVQAGTVGATPCSVKSVYVVGTWK